MVCPDDSTITPDSTACLCKSAYQTFSLSKQKCLCPYSTPVLDPQSGKCIPCDGYYDATQDVCSKCLPGSFMVVNKTTDECVCPSNLPLNAGKYCVTCNDSSFFYDVNTRKCMACPTGMMVNFTTNKCSCPAGQIFTNGKCKCPDQTPFWAANKTCIACYLPSYFNNTSHECESCPLGFKFDTDTKSCQPVQCGQDQIYDNTQNKCICNNPSKPNLLPDNTCSFCLEGQYPDG